MTSLMNNRGGVSTAVAKKFYQQPALVPPMPWISNAPPVTPSARASATSGKTLVSWAAVPGVNKYAVQARYGKRWALAAVATGTRVTIGGNPDALAISSVDRYGTTSVPRVLER